MQHEGATAINPVLYCSVFISSVFGSREGNACRLAGSSEDSVQPLFNNVPINVPHSHFIVVLCRPPKIFVGPGESRVQAAKVFALPFFVCLLCYLFFFLFFLNYFSGDGNIALPWEQSGLQQLGKPVQAKLDPNSVKGVSLQ